MTSIPLDARGPCGLPGLLPCDEATVRIGYAPATGCDVKGGGCEAAPLAPAPEPTPADRVADLCDLYQGEMAMFAPIAACVPAVVVGGAAPIPASASHAAVPLPPSAALLVLAALALFWRRK